MSPLIVVCVLTLAVVSAEKYTSRFDNINVDTILRNERLLRTYFRCLMDQGRCSKDGAELRKHLPEAINNNCAKCTEKQKENVERIMRFLHDKKKDMFSQLEKKYDPQMTYRNKYEKGLDAGKAKEAVKEPELIKEAELIKKEETAKAEKSEREQVKEGMVKVKEVKEAESAKEEESTIAVEEEEKTKPVLVLDSKSSDDDIL